MQHFGVLIVGAGHAGAQAAILLRQLGFEGSIGLVGAEPEPPYERPPLSKDYLAGEKPFERMLIRPASFWPERRIELIPGTRIAAVDPAQKLAAAEDGRVFGYGSMIWAAGGFPYRLSCEGAELAGVHVVRCRSEVDAIRSELGEARRVAVIGGGYVGLETAAVLNGLGKEVVLLEAVDRLLSRVAGPEISHFYEAEHRARGVKLMLGARVERIDGDARAEAVRLRDGERIAADMVIVGIGIGAATGPLQEAGAVSGNGVHVDAHCRTSLPDIYAIGDCAAHENRFAGGARIRLESVQNAHDQAASAVKHIIGRPEPYDSIPWFWSNQYDLRLQTVGLSAGYDQIVLRGSPAERSFSVVYLRQGRVIALDCVNATKDYVQGRKLILDRAAPDPAKLANPAQPLKDLV
ncbi:MAG: FAD-dependent oxidoreductase [Pseudomonadota bacterium]|nr:FAD-dependent oxidoreductase [Pseudomonadota bacterium]